MTDLEQRIHEAWKCAPSDKEILGSAIQPGDEDSPTLQDKVTYAWYYAISLTVRPVDIAEIGVRFGYSLKAMIRALHGIYSPIVLALDAENYGVESNPIAHRNLRGADVASLFIDKRDSQKLLSLDIYDCNGIDIFSVDGDHTEAGAYHDMGLAFEATRNGGLLLVDDVTEPAHHSVRVAVERFTKEKNLEWFVLPTFRGLAVIQVKK